MGNIIVNFKPFISEQEILVYIDGACVKQKRVKIEDVTNVVYGLKSNYVIDVINLVGNKDYVSKFKAELMTKFEKDNVEINIVER